MITIVHLQHISGELKISNRNISCTFYIKKLINLQCKYVTMEKFKVKNQGPDVQSVVSLTSSLRVISLTVLADSIYNILIFFAEKM